MVRIVKYSPINRPNDTDRNPRFDEERPLYSVAAEDAFGDLLAGLTHRPDAAPADVAPPDVASPDVAGDEVARAGLPSVEEFHFEEAAARNMASKLRPKQRPRIKSRRSRYRSPNRDRWRNPDEQDELNEGRDTDRRDMRRPVAAPGGGRRGLFRSFCASILVVIGTSAAFGFVQPLNDLLPERMGAFLSNVSDDLGAGLLGLADGSADIEGADGDPNSGKDVLTPGQPMATAAVAPVPTTPVALAVQRSATSGEAANAEQAYTPAITSKQAFGSGVTALELAPIYGATAEFATLDSAPAPAGRAIEENPPRPALLRSLKAGQLPFMSTPAITREPTSGAAQSAVSSLSAPQIDDLMARGQELLQSGDIASARLVFLRVAAAGDKRGASGMGMTYDPRVYARLPVTGLTPDREQAEIWYKKAGENPTFPTARNDIADTRTPQKPGSPERNAACARKYISFEPNTGLYTSHSGVKRPCRLP